MLIGQLTDLHIRPLGRAAYRVVETNTLVERALRAFSAFRPTPDVLLLTGDLTDGGKPEEYALLDTLLRREVSIPVYAIPGNHDGRESMIANLPGTRHEDGFVQFVVDDFPVRLVMLDTLVSGAPHGELCERRLAWLAQRLDAAPERPTLIALHHPPFVCGIAHMDAINLRQSAEFAELLGRHPQVQRVICGHHHRPITTRIANAVVSIAPSVAHQVTLDLRPDGPSAFVMEPPAWQLHQWTPEQGFVSHTAFVEAYPGPFPFIPERD
jgi:3',5'-cyclic-AMP phosphodiesterase